MRFLVPVVVLVALFLVGFYFYKKNSSPKPLTKEQIEEQQRQELMSYKIDSANQKSEAEQKAELDKFAIPPGAGQLTEEEMRAALTSEETKP